MTITTTSFFLLFSSLLLFHSLAFVSPSTPITPGNACSYTSDPTFCTSVLPPGTSQNLYSYARLSLSKTLAHNYQLLGSVDKQLALNPSSMALQDCQLLLNLNLDYLSSVGPTVNSTDTSTQLSDSESDHLQSLLSALVTNQDTCLDGLKMADIDNGLINSLSNGMKLSSVSLAFFNHAWVNPNRKPVARRGSMPSRTPRFPHKPPKKNSRRLMMFHEVEINLQSGELPLVMKNEKDREIYKQRTRRRLMQSSSDAVLVSDVVVVSQDGSGNFSTISDAVNSAPNNTDGSNGYYLIFVSDGVYEEYVSIPKNKKYVMMIGDGINQTVVTGSHNNVDGWTTFNSATFAVVAQGFVAVNMTFRNTAGAIKNQAVAVRNGADLSTFYSCSFEGYQDTLYTHSLRQFYRECDIYGTVDFIFGNAAVVFQNCNIYPRLPMSGQQNTITAQGRTDPNQNTGTSVLNCTIAASADLAASGGTTKTYLGRPWKEYSMTVFMQSNLGVLIDPAGWLPWSGDFALSTLYYGEYANTGAGSGTSNRVTWPGYHVMNGTDAVNFTVGNFVMGDNWLPQTGVPYSSGLN